MEERLAKLLFNQINYKITPQSTTGTSLAQLFFDRNLKSYLDLLKPDISGQGGPQTTDVKICPW